MPIIIFYFLNAPVPLYGRAGAPAVCLCDGSAVSGVFRHHFLLFFSKPFLFYFFQGVFNGIYFRRNFFIFQPSDSIVGTGDYSSRSRKKCRAFIFFQHQILLTSADTEICNPRLSSTLVAPWIQRVNSPTDLRSSSVLLRILHTFEKQRSNSISIFRF